MPETAVIQGKIDIFIQKFDNLTIKLTYHIFNDYMIFYFYYEVKDESDFFYLILCRLM